MLKFRRKLLATAGAAIAVVAVAAPMAQAEATKPGYERFAGCQSLKENPTVEACIRTVIKSGKFKMGNKDVPITVPMTLSGSITSSGYITATAKAA